MLGRDAARQAANSAQVESTIHRFPRTCAYCASLKIVTFYDLKVERRSGNKTVTLVNNVVCFGIDAKALCQTLRSSLATGATINDEVANCEGPQILINGNQVCVRKTFLPSSAAHMLFLGCNCRRDASERIQNTEAVYQRTRARRKAAKEKRKAMSEQRLLQFLYIETNVFIDKPSCYLISIGKHLVFCVEFYCMQRSLAVQNDYAEEDGLDGVKAFTC